MCFGLLLVSGAVVGLGAVVAGWVWSGGARRRGSVFAGTVGVGGSVFGFAGWSGSTDGSSSILGRIFLSSRPGAGHDWVPWTHRPLAVFPCFGILGTPVNWWVHGFDVLED